jgi:hypothetical protein
MQIFLATLLSAAALAAPTTDPASNVGATSATLNGTADGPGTVYFEYGTTASYGLTTPDQVVSGSEPVAATVSGLTAETTYHFRIVHRTSGPGADQTFTTAANPRPPAISSQRARDIAPTTANATATINANGSATTYRIEYGTSTRYGSETAPVQATGTGNSSVTVTLSGLRPYTRYHWRFVATNAAGTSRGTDRSFRTARLPESVSLGVSRRTVPWGGDVRLGGRVSGAGAAGTPVQLQQQRLLIDADFQPLDTARTGRDGGYLFTIPQLWTTTRYRAVTQTQVVVTSPTATARSRVRVGIRARHHSRRRARIQGSVMPGVGTTATLQYRRDRSWRSVRSVTLTPANETSSRYRFTVRRVKRIGRRFRVVASPTQGTHSRGWSRSVVVRAQPKKKKRRG